MKILKLVNDLGIGGTQRCAQNYAVALKRSGHDVQIIALASLGPRADTLELNGIPTRVVDPVRVASLISDYSPDVIHIHREGPHHPKTSALLLEIRRSFPKVGIVETNVFSRVDYQLPRSVIDLHLQLSDWCLVKYGLWSRGRGPKRDARVVPYMVDDRQFRPCTSAVADEFRKSLGIPRKAFVFGRIGSPIAAKWDPRIIDCFETIRASEAYLVLVGAPRAVIERIKFLNTEKRAKIRLLPLVEGDAKLCVAYSSFDVFLHSAGIGESFGMVLCESLLCETPVITLGTPLRDNTQELLICDCGGGAVARSRYSMAELMESAIQNPESWKTKGRNGARMVRSFFSEQAVIPQLQHAYEQCLQGRAESDPDAKQDHTFERARRRVEQVLQAYPLRVRIAFHLLHTPTLYRMYRALKTIGRDT